VLLLKLSIISFWLTTCRQEKFKEVTISRKSKKDCHTITKRTRRVWRYQRCNQNR